MEISQSPLDFSEGMWGVGGGKAAAHLSLAAAPATELLLERAGGVAGVWCHHGLGAI